MSENNNRIDEMLEQVRSGSLDTTSSKEFDQMAKEAVYDDLSQIAKAQGLKPSYSQKHPKTIQSCETRYDFFMQAIDNLQYQSRLSESYREGFDTAIDRYIGKVELNRSNLSIVDKTLAQELIRVGRNGQNYREMPAGLTSPLARHGYYDGLILIQDLLNKSKNSMMSKVANAVLTALDSQ